MTWVRLWSEHSGAVPEMRVVMFLIPVTVVVRTSLCDREGAIEKIVLKQGPDDHGLSFFGLNFPLQLVKLINPLDPELKEVTEKIVLWARTDTLEQTS